MNNIFPKGFLVYSSIVYEDAKRDFVNNKNARTDMCLILVLMMSNLVTSNSRSIFFMVSNVQFNRLVFH